MERLHRQARGVALVGLILLLAQLWLSWPKPRLAGGIYLDSVPQGALVEYPSAGSLYGFHRKILGRTPGPLPIDAKEKTTFTLVLSLAGYHEETVHLSSEELNSSSRRVRLRPRWQGLVPFVYALRDYAPTVGFGLLGLGFWLRKVRPSLLAQRRTAELLARKQLQPGVELLGYRIEAELGQGGMSRVYQVSPCSGGERLAMKVLRPDWFFDSSARERFRNEVDLWRGLSHPHIVHLLDWGESEGFVWLVTELAPGVGGDKLGRTSFAQLEDWVAQLALALDYAHGQGIVHRDLKPSNLMVDENGTVRLLDFGVAGRLSEQGDSKGHAGTLGFMAPEQLQGRATAASDYYALGCTVYALACGRAPFAAGDGLAMLAAQAQDKYPPLEELRPDCPPAFAEMVSGLLRADPAKRLVGTQAISSALAASKAWRSSSAEP